MVSTATAEPHISPFVLQLLEAGKTLLAEREEAERERKQAQLLAAEKNWRELSAILADFSEIPNENPPERPEWFHHDTTEYEMVLRPFGLDGAYILAQMTRSDIKGWIPAGAKLFRVPFGYSVQQWEGGRSRPYVGSEGTTKTDNIAEAIALCWREDQTYRACRRQVESLNPEPS